MEKLKDLYLAAFGRKPERVEPIAGSGSNRQYYRLIGPGNSAIGAFNEDLKENRAFLSFTRTFLDQGLPVPGILAESQDGLRYLISDLGDQTLFGFLQQCRTEMFPENTASQHGESGNLPFPEKLVPVYKEVLAWLPGFQVSARPDYRLCYPRDAFDRQSMLWDLNYFKYHYLKLAGIAFDEQHLEDDFRVFTSFLLEAPSDFFMYRDFQSRNVMLYEGKPWFIDYQGGRRGALQYDLASLLYDAKADIPPVVRDELMESYLASLSGLMAVDRRQFLAHYPGFVLIRILQAMGAYGFRGYFEKKAHFLQSIPYALRNLSALIGQPFLNPVPELKRVIERMLFAGNPVAEASGADAPQGGLTILVVSFSYKKGLPVDPSTNGGGFIFDCRALPNPGRFEEYKTATGRDPSVIAFLSDQPGVGEFLSGSFKLVDQSINAYLERKFTHLMVGYGCTGGQHRSVYCAESLAAHLRQKFPVNVVLKHREQE
jgi:aminoglycoside/choline kinase family phosphotransferase